MFGPRLLKSESIKHCTASAAPGPDSEAFDAAAIADPMPPRDLHGQSYEKLLFYPKSFTFCFLHRCLRRKDN